MNAPHRAADSLPHVPFSMSQAHFDTPMKNVTLLIYAASFSVGLTALVVSALLFLKYGLILLKYYLFFLVFFTAALIADTVNLSIRSFIDYPTGLMHIVRGIITLAACCPLIYIVPLFVHRLVGVVFTTKKKILFAILGGLTLVVSLSLLFSPSGSNANAADIGIFICGGILFSTILYSCVIALKNATAIKNEIIRNLVKNMAVISISATAFFIVDVYYLRQHVLPLIFPDGFCFNPFIYFFWNICSIVVFGRYFFLKSVQFEIKDNLHYLAKQYGITNREFEIVNLVMEGLSNEGIGGRIGVSLSTVKKHVYNIYQKMGINNRMELVNLLRRG